MEYKPKAKRETRTNAKGKEYVFVSKEELAAFKKAGLGSTLTDLMNYEAKMRKGSKKSNESGKAKPMSSEKRRPPPRETTKAKKSTAPSEGNAGATLRAVESMLGIDYGSKPKKTAEDLKKQRRMRNERLGMSSGGAAKKKK